MHDRLDDFQRVTSIVTAHALVPAPQSGPLDAPWRLLGDYNGAGRSSMQMSTPRTSLSLRLIALPLSLGTLLGMGAVAAGRQASEEKAPIEAKAKPAVALAGSTVTISGKTVVDGKRFTVAFTVTPPGGAPVKLTAKADANGAFTLAYKIKAKGDYAVAITAPDGKGTTAVKFKSVGGQSFGDELGSSLKSLVQSSIETTQSVKSGLEGSPDSPAKAQADAKLDELQKGEEGLAAKADAAGKALGRVAKVVEEHPELAPAFEPYAEAFAEYEQEADDLRDHGTEYLKKVKGDTFACESLDFANEALSLLSMEMDLQGRVMKKLLNLGTDKVFPGALDKTASKASDIARFGLSEAQKTAFAAAGGYEELRGSVFGLVADTVQLISKKVFDKYCQKLEGPITANLDATFDSDGGQPYWKYGVKLSGKISLRYPKSATKGTVTMRGQIEGNATAFTFWEDVEKIERFPKGGMVLLRKRITPVSGAAFDPNGKVAGSVSDAFGRFARAGTPASFMIPIEGKLTKNKLTITMEDAVWDFTDDGVKNRLVLVFANPILPIPIIKTFNFPVLKARFIINRGMSSDHPEFTVQTDSNSSSIERDFNRKFDGPKGDYHITFNVKVQASNPPAG